MPAVTATILYVNGGTAKEEIVAIRVAGINAEMPIACVPVERTIEIGGVTESTILPRQQDVAEVEVATLPIETIQVVDGAHTHQVVEVYLVCCLILLVGEVKFIRHLVGEEQRLLTGLLITHSSCRHGHHDHCYKGEYKLFHNLISLNLFFTVVFFSLMQR